MRLLCYSPIFGIPAHLPGDIPDEDAQDRAGEDVAGEVHEQIHAGKGDDTGQAVGCHAQAPAETEQDRCASKEKERMARREGIADRVFQRSQRRRIGNDQIRPDAHDDVLDGHITDEDGQEDSDDDGNRDPPALPFPKTASSQDSPEPDRIDNRREPSHEHIHVRPGQVVQPKENVNIRRRNPFHSKTPFVETRVSIS